MENSDENLLGIKKRKTYSINEGLKDFRKLSKTNELNGFVNCQM